MSYTSTMQFLNTGMATGAGTEDPRFAGRSIAGACGGPRPCGAPIAGGIPSTCMNNVCGPMPPFGKKKKEQQTVLDWFDCMDWCGRIAIEMQGGGTTPSRQPAPVRAKAKPVRPVWARIAYSSSRAGKSRADAIRLSS